MFFTHTEEAKRYIFQPLGCSCVTLDNKSIFLYICYKHNNFDVFVSFPHLSYASTREPLDSAHPKHPVWTQPYTYHCYFNLKTRPCKE